MPFGFLHGLSALRLRQAVQNGSDEIIVFREAIACTFFGIVLAVAVWAVWRWRPSRPSQYDHP
jgi:hypothetical protein